jgi:hypothetical protein
MVPQYSQVLFDAGAVSRGLNMADFLGEMEERGWTLVSIWPLFGVIVVLHRRMVPFVEGEGEDGETPAGTNGPAADGSSFAA